MADTELNVTLWLRVHDKKAFVAAARARAIADGERPAEARRNYTASNLRACALALLDPGLSPPGSEILDSSAE